MRTVIFWAHLATALSAAAIILIMAVTGVLLTYQRQVQAWADTRGLDGHPPTAGAVPLVPEALLEAAARTRAGAPTALRWRNDTDAPVEVVYGLDTTLFVNAYTGAVLGDGSERMRGFFRSVTAWHRWLALSDEHRPRGRAITGAANLAFLFMLMSGFYLWWPRTLTRRALRNVLLFRRGLSGKARDFNWHNVIGFWSLIPLAVVVSSAVVISYGWANGLVDRIAGDDAPGPIAPPAAAESIAAADDTNGPGQLQLQLERARARMPDWHIITMQVPARSGTYAFTLDRGDGGQPQKRAQLTLSSTGEVVSWRPFSSGSRGERVRSVLRFAHTGEVGGIAGQSIAGLVSGGAVVMVWTGIALALRRFTAWRGRLRRRRGSVPGSGDSSDDAKQAA